MMERNKLEDNFKDTASMVSHDTVMSNEEREEESKERADRQRWETGQKYLSNQREQHIASIENENKKLIEELNLVRAQLEAEKLKREAIEAKERAEREAKERQEKEERERVERERIAKAEAEARAAAVPVAAPAPILTRKEMYNKILKTQGLDAALCYINGTRPN